MITRFKDIELDEYVVIQKKERFYGDQDHSRMVLRENSTNLYYKFWNKSYIRSKHILDAYNIGFFIELCPALVSIILDDDVCVGYITHECESGSVDYSDINNLYNKLISATKTYKYFYYDWEDVNLMKYKGNAILLDLESVYPISELDNVVSGKYHCEFKNKDYREFVYGISTNK